MDFYPVLPSRFEIYPVNQSQDIDLVGCQADLVGSPRGL